MQFTTTGSPSAEEAAAAVAAIMTLLTEEEVVIDDQPASLTRWQDSMRLIAQGMPPMRLPVPPRWSTIERLRRAGRGGMGIVGM